MCELAFILHCVHEIDGKSASITANINIGAMNIIYIYICFNPHSRCLHCSSPISCSRFIEEIRCGMWFISYIRGHIDLRVQLKCDAHLLYCILWKFTAIGGLGLHVRATNNGDLDCMPGKRIYGKSSLRFYYSNNSINLFEFNWLESFQSVLCMKIKHPIIIWYIL